MRDKIEMWWHAHVLRHVQKKRGGQGFDGERIRVIECSCLANWWWFE